MAQLQRVRVVEDHFQLVDRAHAGRGGHRKARGDAALEAGDADHEELVEVRGEDREEADPLQQVQVRVLGELEHAGVEVQPAQFPVQEPVVGEIAVGHRGGAEVGQLDPVLGRAGRRHVGEAQGGGDWLRVHGVCP